MAAALQASSFRPIRLACMGGGSRDRALGAAASIRRGAMGAAQGPTTRKSGAHMAAAASKAVTPGGLICLAATGGTPRAPPRNEAVGKTHAWSCPHALSTVLLG